MQRFASIFDSLRHVVALKDSLVQAALAHPETVAVAVPDTVVRVASASLGWWAEFWRILAQLGAAALAVLGGFLVQKHLSDRAERRSDVEIRNQAAIGVSRIESCLRPIRDRIVRDRVAFPKTVQELRRRVQSFEALLPRLLQLRDEAHATRLYMWFMLAESVPEAVEVFTDSQAARRDLPEPTPLDAELARLQKESGKPQRTIGEAALQRIGQVLGQARGLGVSFNFYDDGEAILPILTSSPARLGQTPPPQNTGPKDT